MQSLPLSAVSSVTLVMHMYDSWGDGWNGAWYYIYDSSEQVASGTLWSGSYGSDTFTVPSQANLSIQVTAGSYASEISWELAQDGLVIVRDTPSWIPGYQMIPFSLLGAGGTGSFEVSILAGTSVPSGADTLLTFCALTSGGNSMSASTPLLDFSPPAGFPASLTFEDTNGGVGIISGQVTVGRATDETGISEYKIYLGTGPSTKLPSSTAIASISSTSSILAITLPDTTLPNASSANYLLAFASGATGENPQAAFVEIVDLQRPMASPSGVTFTDLSPDAGWYEGAVNFHRAEDEVAITHYRCYWATSSTAPDFSFPALGEVSVSSQPRISVSSTQAPTGMTHLVVVSANGAYSMPTGSGVLLVDYSTITVVPSSVEFQDTDASLANIGGAVTIGAASDESQVVDYVVYWGATSAAKLPAGSPGLYAEFFDLVSCPCSTCFVDFSTLGTAYLTRVDTDWTQYSSSRPGGSLSVWPGLSTSEMFAARWTGWVQIITPGDYYWSMSVNDNSKLFIDGAEVDVVTTPHFFDVGVHQVELQYFQCLGSSYISLTVAGPDTNWVSMSLWQFTRTGTQEVAPIVTAAKTGSTVVATIPASTQIPESARYFLVFARTVGNIDSAQFLGTEVLDLVKPSVTAGSLQFTDLDPSLNMIQGILTIARAQNEANLNFYKVYWGSTATQIVNATRRLQSTSSLEPSCIGVTCSSIEITMTSANTWTVSRGIYSNYEEAFITLTGPAEVRFTELSTESCCDKLYFPEFVSSPVSGSTIPGIIILPDGVHSVQWRSDYSVVSNGWSFTYSYTGTASNTPGLVALIPKPSGSQDLAVLIESQELIGSYFIVKTGYNSTESDASVALEVVDWYPPQLPVGAVTFTDTNTDEGIISGSVTVAAGSSDITGFNIYWARDSSNLISQGNPGLSGEYFYLSSPPSSMPDFSAAPDVVQVETQLNQPETTSPWPGLTVTANFAARWTGYINITAAGNYFFTLSSDAGSQLFINDAMVVDNDGRHAFQSVTSQGVYLLPGLRSLQVLFFNDDGSYGIVLKYQGPDTSNLRIVVPPNVLRHGSLNNAFIGQIEAAASGDTIFQVQNLAVPQEGSHILVKGYNAQGEGASGSSTEIADAFSPTEMATALYFTDMDPTPGQIAGTIVVQGATNQSSISHYVIYWGSSATAKADSNPIGQISASGSGFSSGLSCGVKGPDSTPFEFRRNGINGPKIVNGQDASECEWRWQASLRSHGHAFCGGALISPKWVMSAAHCMDGTTNFVVVLGDFNKDSSHDQHERSYSVQRVISHENFNSETMIHDFALIELAEEVDMGECVATACLPETEVTVGQECFITGWGTLSSGGYSPSTLQEGRVLTLSNSECNARYGDITADMLCAQGSSSAGIVDACQGDSGGPMVCPGQDGRYILHGATSWGIGCAAAEYPGVWARISHVLPWVTNLTGIQPGTASGNLTYNISSQSIPSSATHLLVYTAMNGLEMTTGISIPLVDFAPVQVVPASISFTDTDASPGELGGTITLGRASDESEVIGYAVFWGTESVVMDLAVQGLKGSGDDVELQLPANTPKPAGATHLLGFVTSSSGRGATYVSVNVTDLDLSSVPGGLTFQDTDPGATRIGGAVTIQQAAATTGVFAYNLYFSTGSCDVVGSQIVSLPVLAGGDPICIHGANCSSITILEESPRLFLISRGMDGYQDDERATIQLQGPGLIEFTRFDTERGYDTLRVDEAIYSGFDLPANLELGAGTKEIEWFSDFSVTRQGWSLYYQSYSTFGDITYELPHGTAIPSGANSLIAFSQTSAGENTAACASTTLVDFAPPSGTAQGLWFEDENPSAGRVAGTLTILQARSNNGIGSSSEYRIYWGMNSTSVLQGSNMLFAVTASTPNTNLTVSLNETLPINASHLLAFIADSQGQQALSSASTEVIDYAPAQQSAQSVSFTDVNPRVGEVSGTATIIRALDESTIDRYNLYFSSGQSRISFIGFAPATTILSARPSCSGPTCSVISITEVAGLYQVSRGNSYNNLEEATLFVTGPGTIRFIYFNTEQIYDFVTILGVSYSGTTTPYAPPEAISIPSGSHQLFWWSDGSVTPPGGGWTFMYESLVSNDVVIEVPQSAIPAGATDLLLVSNASGGEMSSGVTTPLVDYNPPTVVAEFIRCQDNDNTIGFIEGTCTVGRAADETGVSAYEIFWGNATHLLSTSLGRLALADVTGSPTEVIVQLRRFAVDPSASHLLAFATGDGGVAPSGISTPLVDNIGLTLSSQSIDVLGTSDSSTNQTIIVTSVSSESVTLNISLLIEDGSANSRISEESQDDTGVGFSESTPSSTVPTICLEGASHVQKSRLIFKMKKGSGHGRRLQAHARKLESRHGARVKTFGRLGGLAFAEIKDASVESYCRLFTELDHDPDVDFVEEDQTWHALGHTVQVEQPEYDLFPPGGKKTVSERRLGHMHRRAPQCHLGDCQGGRSTHPNDGSYGELWGLHQDNDIDIDAPEAWEINKGLSGQVIVAVIDTGVDYNHEDLRNQMQLDFQSSIISISIISFIIPVLLYSRTDSLVSPAGAGSPL